MCNLLKVSIKIKELAIMLIDQLVGNRGLRAGDLQLFGVVCLGLALKVPLQV